MAYQTTHEKVNEALKNQVEVDLSNYPTRVQALTVVVNDGPYFGWCSMRGYQAIVTTTSFSHEMGHATVKLLGIEKELGKMVMASPNAKSETNENIFCYGAQRLAAGDYNTAIEEYAADAIRAYTENWAELPQNIKEYIEDKFNNKII